MAPLFLNVKIMEYYELNTLWKFRARKGQFLEKIEVEIPREKQVYSFID